MAMQGKPIPNMPGYRITRDGKVYSDRQNSDGKEVVSTDHGHDYARVVLMVNGKKTTKYVHELLAMTYHGGVKESIRHLDGNKKHNTADNIKPGTRSENEQDKQRHKSMKKSLSTIERYYVVVKK